MRRKFFKNSFDVSEWRTPLPEFELIRVLYARLVGRQLPEGFALRTEGYDWNRAMRLVENHRFLGPAARLVRESRGDFPTDFAEGIERRFRAKCMQNMVLVRRQVELLDAFRGGDVAVTFFKGPVLAERLYHNQNTRFSHDIDMLVGPGEIGRADVLLHRLGYRRLNPAIRDGDLSSYFSRHKHAGYLHCEDRTLVEIHSRLHDNWYEFPVSPERVWRHRIEVELFGCRIPTFDDEFLLTYLSFHAAHHFLRRLFWLADISTLRGLMAPDRLAAAADVAAECGCGKHLSLCGRMGDSMADLSGNVRLGGFPRYVSGYVFGTWERTHLDGDEWYLRESPARRVNRILYDRHLIVGPFRKTGFLLHTIFSPGDLDYDMVRLPRCLRWLYYPLRFVRLSSLYLRKGLSACLSQARRRNITPSCPPSR